MVYFSLCFPVEVHRCGGVPAAAVEAAGRITSKSGAECHQGVHASCSAGFPILKEPGYCFSHLHTVGYTGSHSHTMG